MNEINRRGFIKGLIGATSLVALDSLLQGCEVQPSYVDNVTFPAQKHPGYYENNNNSLADGKVASIQESVELIRVDSIYQKYVEDKPTCEVKKLRWHGSGTVVTQDQMYYYVLTAGHVALAEKERKDIFGNTYKLARQRIHLPYKNVNLELLAGELNDNLDFAYLRCPRVDNLKVMNAKIGDSDKLMVNDMVYAFGYPLSTGNSVTSGIVSCTYHKEPEKKKTKAKVHNEQFLFSSPISPGNSGGPVFAIQKGELYLVGVAVASYVYGQNMNIAIKINDILRKIR
ncbi:hypothetical protein D6777_00730 [Candidatus Woesearchaeota archaeon]|nr:MAG: hypothetical protein D6777_00730 [Candidatus Woesearchaeota archaeon]